VPAESTFPPPGRGLRDRLDQLASHPVSEPSSNENSGRGRNHLLFVWSPTGYQLAEHEGEPPAVGDEIEHADRRYRVIKLGPSPLPGDKRVCAYLQA
jgi:hypothetical protein